VEHIPDLTRGIVLGGQFHGASRHFLLACGGGVRTAAPRKRSPRQKGTPIVSVGEPRRGIRPVGYFLSPPTTASRSSTTET
jgi:hypothetical protein